MTDAEAIAEVRADVDALTRPTRVLAVRKLLDAYDAVVAERDEALAAMSADVADVVLAKCIAGRDRTDLRARLDAKQITVATLTKDNERLTRVVNAHDWYTALRNEPEPRPAPAGGKEEA